MFHTVRTGKLPAPSFKASNPFIQQNQVWIINVLLSCLQGILFLILLTQHITVERQRFYKFLWTLNRSWCGGVGEIWSRIREQRHVVNRIFDWLEELQPGLAPHQGRVTEHWIMLFVRQCVERGPRQPRTHTLSLTLKTRVTTWSWLCSNNYFSSELFPSSTLHELGPPHPPSPSLLIMTWTISFYLSCLRGEGSTGRAEGGIRINIVRVFTVKGGSMRERNDTDISNPMIIYRMVIVEGRCTKMQL